MGRMKKTDTLVFASVVAAAMIFGGVLGATFLAKSTLTDVNAAQSAASPSPTPKSNEATANEAGESAAQEAAENNGTARPAGAAGVGHPNEDPTHEAGESAAREAAENAAKASPAPTTN
jgi:hypothetical protein